MKTTAPVAPSTATHCDVEMHDTSVSPPPPASTALSSTRADVAEPGAVGSKVISAPWLSTPTHRDGAGHDTAASSGARESLLVSTVATTAPPGEPGLNVTSFPLPEATSAAVHWLVVGHEIEPRWAPVSTEVAVGLPGALGSNVTSRPAASTAVHCDVAGQAIADSDPPLSTVTGVGLPGELGSKVTSCPEPSTPVHWVGEAHATAVSARGPLPSIVVGLGLPGACGLNVTSRPDPSTPVHCVSEGQAIAPSFPPVAWGVGDPGALGLKVISFDPPSNTVHCDTVGHAMPIKAVPSSIVTGVGVPGDVGSNVTS